MTLAMAWIRDVGEYQELVFCSDSRLRFGCAWDSCQKVFPLPRGDCAIAFAGDTQFAYPFIHTAINAISLHQRTNRREVDLYDVQKVLINAINSMLAEIRDLPKGMQVFEEPNIRLIFGGYSWKKKKFAIWKFSFNNGEREFRVQKIGFWKGAGKGLSLVIIGDPNASHSAKKRAKRLKENPYSEEEDVEVMAKKRLLTKLESRGLKDKVGLNLEPFEVLCEMIKEKVSPYVGGAPQFVKVYQHMNVQPFGVRWIDSDGRVAILGRLLSKKEKLDVPILDPETLRVERKFSAVDFTATRILDLQNTRFMKIVP